MYLNTSVRIFKKTFWSPYRTDGHQLLYDLLAWCMEDNIKDRWTSPTLWSAAMLCGGEHNSIDWMWQGSNQTCVYSPLYLLDSLRLSQPLWKARWKFFGQKINWSKAWHVIYVWMFFFTEFWKNLNLFKTDGVSWASTALSYTHISIK